MAAKPRDLIEHVSPAVVIQQNPSVRISGEELLLKFLRKKFRSSDHHGFVFLPSAEVDQPQLRKLLFRHRRLHQHLRVVLMAFQQMLQHLIHCDFRSLTKLHQRFLVRECTTLTTAQMIACKNRPPRTRQGFQNHTHRRLGSQFGSLHLPEVIGPKRKHNTGRLEPILLPQRFRELSGGRSVSSVAT